VLNEFHEIFCGSEQPDQPSTSEPGAIATGLTTYDMRTGELSARPVAIAPGSDFVIPSIGTALALLESKFQISALMVRRNNIL
jgi:hypothetical protein